MSMDLTLLVPVDLAVKFIHGLVMHLILTTLITFVVS